MKPQLLKVFKDESNSFNARRGTKPDVNNRWHFHPELELVYFKEGEGIQFIGDDISTFSKGDVVLVGSNLPHYWQFNEEYFVAQTADKVDVAVIHFNELFWGEAFLNLPENKPLRSLLEKSKRGIQLGALHDPLLGTKVEQIISLEGTRKVLALIEVLLTLAESKDIKLLATVGFQHNFLESEKDRINAIYNYSISNFRKKITLEEIAEVAAMSPNSFCKFFKSRSRKTYSEFINEIRIGHACKLLIESDYNIKEICFQSGFNNFSSFHKFFKLLKGKSPLAYQKSFRKPS
ncbi:AraC family transcriptional regulator [Desertivirga brevis]|uniref:AraC family transcriptional regulator n=1 Tax=Desertivirga brevis TaxID=2810310 RepID=UPI001A9574C3|nr:AraC family transcriptional regulator [Pedobacter sp. SYSU D00873]